MTQYDLVFEGGGAKGMAFVGALSAFERAEHTPGRLLGTSAGAIAATLLAAGYTAAEMGAALLEREGSRSVFAGFLGEPKPMDKAAIAASVLRAVLRDINLPLVPEFIESHIDDQLAGWMASSSRLRHVVAFLESGGLYTADHFNAWFARCLDRSTPGGAPRALSGLTLAGFHGATGANLTLVASDLTARRMLILNHVTAPDLPVVWAVRLSMNIPLIWPEVIWLPAWGAYRGRSMEGHAIVDGGLLSNFPLELFTSKLDGVIALMGPRTGKDLIGLLIDEALPVPGIESAEQTPTGARANLLPTERRLASLIDTTLSARDALVIDEFAKLVVRLPAKGIGTTEFDLAEARRDRLVAAGEAAMTAYLDDVAANPVSFAPGDPAVRRRQVAADRLAQRFLDE